MRHVATCVKHSTCVMFTILLLPTGTAAETITLKPIKDTTLYEHALGTLGNGAGERFLVGLTRGGRIRRGLVAFDVAGSVPAGATIDSARLRLRMSRTQVGARTIRLHRVLHDWGEGTSNASGQEGRGTGARPGDATWIHTFYDTSLWTSVGGDFAETVSASRDVSGIGFYAWTGEQLGSDIQSMLDDPSNNFGWILIGDETRRSAKRFDSREHPTLSNHPRLIIEYTFDTTPPEIAVDVTPKVLWPPNHKLVDILAGVTVTDNIDPAPTFVLSSITSSESDNGNGSGNKNGDIRDADVGTPDVEYRLRAERRGNGGGRTYTIVYTASDNSGNTASTTVSVFVPHDQSGGDNGPPGSGAKKRGGGDQLQTVTGATRTLTTLEGIFPNPFNPSTTIEFRLADVQPVTLKIYDARGALVRTLVNSTLAAGPHRVLWDGRSDMGESSATGIYLLRMITADFRTTRKLVLLK